MAKVKGNGRITTTITVVGDEEYRKLVRKYATLNDVPIAQVVRDAIDAHIGAQLEMLRRNIENGSLVNDSSIAG